MTGFSYKSVKQQVVDSQSVTPGQHIARLTRIGAVLNKNQEPMLIPEFTIEDVKDDDTGKVLSGFLSFPGVWGDLQMQNFENFMLANGQSFDGLDGQSITVEFLKQWGAMLIGNVLRIESGYGSGAYAGKPIVKNYYPIDNASQGLIDLD